MNNWQERFAQKMNNVRSAAKSRFAGFARKTLKEVFEQFREFAGKQGLEATAPLARPDVRTFKFAMTENAYLLMTFRVADFNHCDLKAEVSMPNVETTAPFSATVEIIEADREWAQTMFERSLDAFADTCATAFSASGKQAPGVELIGA